MEIEEIYTDVVKQKHIDNEQERKTFEYANGYIFPTELLDKSVNTKGKPSAVIYGTYKNEKRYEKSLTTERHTLSMQVSLTRIRV